MPAEIARLTGVYLLTPDSSADDFNRVVDIIKLSLDLGVRAIQYRDKTSDDGARRFDRACRLVALTHAAGALLIVNDSVDVATRSAADGVHLGRDDGDVVQARRRLPDQLLGVSCYNRVELARDAIANGADAVAFGSVFDSMTKPAAVRAPLALVSEARSTWPQQCIVAIGGINVANIASVAAAGAHAAAVLGAVFGADSPQHAVPELIRRFDHGKIQYDEQRATV